MNVTRNILITIICALPFLSKGQDFVTFMVHPHHVDSISSVYSQNPNLSSYLSLDSTTLRIWVYADNCKAPEIVADSIQFSLTYSSNSLKRDTSIMIKPDTVTTFESHLFAYMIYEGAELFKNPKKSRKPIHTVVETDTYDTLIFHNQYIDRKGQVWYNVQIIGNRYWNPETNIPKETPIQTQGWMLKGRTRTVYFGNSNHGCL